MRPAHRDRMPLGVFHERPGSFGKQTALVDKLTVNDSAVHPFDPFSSMCFGGKVSGGDLHDSPRRPVQFAFLDDLQAMAGRDRQKMVSSSYRLGVAVSEGHGNPLFSLSFAGGLTGPDERVRTNCSWGLGRMALRGMPIGTALKGLEEALGDVCRDVRANSAIALMLHYSNSNDDRSMERLVNHPRHDVCRSAASVLPHLRIS